MYMYMYMYCVFVCVYVYRSPPRQLQDPTAAHPTHGACSDGSTVRSLRCILEFGARESLVCVDICIYMYTCMHTYV